MSVTGIHHNHDDPAADLSCQRIASATALLLDSSSGYALSERTPGERRQPWVTW